MTFRTLDQLDVSGKRVLTRVDFNVPLEGKRITDDTRISSAVPTIQALLQRGAAVILVSHLGRPKGQPDTRYSLKPIAEHLSGLLGLDVQFADDIVGVSARSIAANLQPGEVLLLENIRFEPGEEKNDSNLSGQLASLADVYVNDAFGAAHRAHASTEGVADFLPSAAGLLMASELEALGKVVADPEKPLVVIMGGAKISDKIGVLRQFLGKADAILVGGGIANTLMAAQGRELGTSLVERDSLDTARQILREATEGGCELVLPSDFVVAPSPDRAGEHRVTTEVNPGEAILDIGPAAIRTFSEHIARARTIVWNGPMGLFEVPPFDTGTREIAEAVANSEAYSVIGGGDSVAAIQQSGLADRISHISTGGGASLELLEGRTLPGVAALEGAAR